MKQRLPYPIGVLPYRHSIIGRTLLTVPRPPAVSLCPLMHCATAFFSFRADRIPWIHRFRLKAEIPFMNKIAQSRGILHHARWRDLGEIFSRDRRRILVRGCSLSTPDRHALHAKINGYRPRHIPCPGADRYHLWQRGIHLSRISSTRILPLSARRTTNMKNDAGGFVLLWSMILRIVPT